MSVQNFQSARESMVQSQLHPSGVSSETVLNAYKSVPREVFVPEHLRAICYLDESLPLGNGQILFEPMLHGKMIERLNILSTDKALDLGDPTGYSAAILSRLAREVTVVDNPSPALADSRKNWLTLGYHNISSAQPQGPYDVIVINGAVAEIPQDILALLGAGGRLACILQTSKRAVGKIAIVTKEASGAVATKLFEDASAPFLPGHEAKEEFVF